MVQSPGETGYGKPPRNTQFKRGQSGNPKGRPRLVSFKSELTAELNETIELTDSNGKLIKITKQRALIKMLMGSALQNEKGAINALLMSMKFFGVGFDDDDFSKSETIEDLQMIKQYLARSEAKNAMAQVDANNDDETQVKNRKDEP